MKKRVEQLIRHDLNLFAYHLPLDAHPQLGNNAALGRRLGLRVESHFAEQNLGWLGSCDWLSLRELAEQIELQLGRTPTVVGQYHQTIRKVAWCTGGAQGMIEAAYVAGADVFISGEISEQTTHFAREMGIAYIACGHHASERYGVQDLGEHLRQANAGELAVAFFDSDNPA